MQKMISNILFTKNRPLQLDAYLESLYRYFSPSLIQTYIIYKEELFAAEYEQLFKKYMDSIIIKESDFHSDFMRILEQVRTKYILFGIDDVVFYDAVDFEVIDKTFDKESENIFGFTLRFSKESLKSSGDIIEESPVDGEKIFRLNWKNGHTAHTRYPFELCCTFYMSVFVKKIIYSSMSSSPLAKKLFCPSSALINFLGKIGRKRSTLKRFGYFFSPNTLESWPCKWCLDNRKLVPDYIYFQKLCASAVQVNMVNTTTRNDHDGTEEHTVEALNDKYKQGYRFDIDSITKNKPGEPGCGREYFKLKKA
jgi:hypothetical protein